MKGNRKERIVPGELMDGNRCAYGDNCNYKDSISDGIKDSIGDSVNDSISDTISTNNASKSGETVLRSVEMSIGTQRSLAVECPTACSVHRDNKSRRDSEENAGSTFSNRLAPFSLSEDNPKGEAGEGEGEGEGEGSRESLTTSIPAGVDREREAYVCSCRALLIGIGADEQMAGYGRHRTTFLRGGRRALVDELNKDMDRIWRRNLVLNCLILYFSILYYTILYYTILYYTILYYTILYYTILYYTILYYTILY